MCRLDNYLISPPKKMIIWCKNGHLMHVDPKFYTKCLLMFFFIFNVAPLLGFRVSTMSQSLCILSYKFHVKFLNVHYLHLHALLGLIVFILTQHDTHALWFVKWYTVNNLCQFFKKIVNEIHNLVNFFKFL
jgi:hypothetical protein